MNSSGIGLLVTLLIRIQRQKQRLVAYGLTDHYIQIFELTRLNEAIENLRQRGCGAGRCVGNKLHGDTRRLHRETRRETERELPIAPCLAVKPPCLSVIQLCEWRNVEFQGREARHDDRQ